ncbi:inositol monophosphatase family protein, partial [Synechococcus sp.]
MAIQTDQQLLEIAQAAASAGALALKKHWGKLEQVRCKGRPGDLVTEADLAAEAAVLEVLQQHTPEIGVLAEEAGRQGPAGALQWCVDPLDGTTNYAHGFPLFACSVGLLKNGQPHLGAIEAPALQQSYWGG